MDLQTATDLLEINVEQLSSFDSNILKKQYHKMALLHHPDKCGGSSLDATMRFQQIQSAYQYLSSILTDDNNSSPSSSFEPNKEEINYYEILCSFIKHASTSPSATNHLFSSIVQDILSGFLSIALFDSVDKEFALDIYSFLVKHQRTIRISDPLLNKVRDILLKKYEQTHLVTINPTLTDMFSSNVYKLVFKEEIYYIPMWHEEIHYDCLNVLPFFTPLTPHPPNSDTPLIVDLIVKCVPEVPHNVALDEQNNVLVSLTVDLASIHFPSIPFSIDGHHFYIPCDELLLKKTQHYTIKGAGIPKIDETDMYNDAIKSDIIVKVLLKTT